MKRFGLMFAVVAVFMAMSVPAMALITESATMNVSTTVAASCAITTTELNFGTVVGNGPTNQQGSVTVNCVNGISYVIAINNGFNGYDAQRSVMGPGGEIDYELYTDPARTEIWGDTGYGDTYAGTVLSYTSSGAPTSHQIYGQLKYYPGWSNFSGKSAGSYTDTVSVTINY